MDRYQLEDLILWELRRTLNAKVDDVDVGTVHVAGRLDLGRLAEVIWDRRHEMTRLSFRERRDEKG